MYRDFISSFSVLAEIDESKIPAFLLNIRFRFQEQVRKSVSHK